MSPARQAVLIGAAMFSVFAFFAPGWAAAFLVAAWSAGLTD